MQSPIRILAKPGWVGEFQAFILRGNVVDLAVGIIIGAAFTSIVTSLVKDLFTPLLGLALGGIDFTNLFITLKGEHLPTLDAAQKAFGHDEYRVVPERRDFVPDRELCDLLDCEGTEPVQVQGGRGTRRADAIGVDADRDTRLAEGRAAGLTSAKRPMWSADTSRSLADRARALRGGPSRPGHRSTPTSAIPATG